MAAICDRYGIAELKIFGSRARGTTPFSAASPRTGMAELTDPHSSDPPPLRRAATAYETAINQLVEHPGLPA
ncbi:hypothetical protein [Frankia sp. Cas4]|uniref:hypothetical protein n=1 Tax=Frankia sp. Cas4 TaxID=3073927 RepID=UPI002AD583D8|nr:hypothetical protein [Frankia sp. Cas4]